MNPLKSMEDPVLRTSSPYSDPLQKGPRSQQLATGTLNYHSTSLRNMVSNSVNKTALHPGGVQCVFTPLLPHRPPAAAAAGVVATAAAE